jgi:GGDEF domain-containing protein
VARLAGDEFVIVFEQVASEDERRGWRPRS